MKRGLEISIQSQHLEDESYLLGLTTSSNLQRVSDFFLPEHTDNQESSDQILLIWRSGDHQPHTFPVSVLRNLSSQYLQPRKDLVAITINPEPPFPSDPPIQGHLCDVLRPILENYSRLYQLRKKLGLSGPFLNSSLSLSLIHI